MNIMEFVQQQFAVSQNGISFSWLACTVLLSLWGLKIKLFSRKK